MYKLIAFERMENAILMTEERFRGTKLAPKRQGRTQMTSSQSTCIRDYFGLSIVFAFVMILDRLNQHLLYFTYRFHVAVRLFSNR